MLALLDQTFAAHDLVVILLLIVLEGTLSVDNALVLGLMAKRLPPEQRQKALTYGLIGAFVFRVAAIGFAAWLLHYPVVKLIGGLYLIYVAVKHFVTPKHHDHDEHEIDQDNAGRPQVDSNSAEAREAKIAEAAPAAASGLLDAGKASGRKYAKFFPTIVAIELTDVAFAVDSILAALAFIPPNPNPGQTNPKLWVVMVGGFIGVVLMRFAAVVFVRLLEKFPRFEEAAYLLVTVIGLKLVIDWAGNKYFASPENPHPVDFHSVGSPAFWIFWVSMVICFAVGFIGKKPTTTTNTPAAA